MFSKGLEDLIQATLEDGVLEDYEKAALVKRAQAEGVDLTELEIYINSILQKRQKAQKEAENAREEQHEKEKKAAFGRVCPNCGRQVPPLTTKCVCGYEFGKQDAVSSSKLLADKLNTVHNMCAEERQKRGELSLPEREELEKSELERVRETIKMFPVPNTKEDIVEFLSYCIGYSKEKRGLGTKKGLFKLAGIIIIIFAIIGFAADGMGGAFSILIIVVPVVLVFTFGIIETSDTVKQNTEFNKTARVWRDKFRQVMIKGRSLQGDPDFQRQLDYFEAQMAEK